jgi:hypothetical protein
MDAFIVYIFFYKKQIVGILHCLRILSGFRLVFNYSEQIIFCTNQTTFWYYFQGLNQIMKKINDFSNNIFDRIFFSQKLFYIKQKRKGKNIFPQKINTLHHNKCSLKERGK